MIFLNRQPDSKNSYKKPASKTGTNAMKILYIIKVAFKSMNKDIYLINDVDTTG